VREMLHRLKYGREMWLAKSLSCLLAEGIQDERITSSWPDAIVPVPLHPKRLREREFNQAEILAEGLSQATGLPVCRALARRRYTITQTSLDRQARRQNLRDAFVLSKNADVTDLDLLLVDDVLTTGATVDACAAALVAGGASRVRALTVARG